MAWGVFCLLCEFLCRNGGEICEHGKKDKVCFYDFALALQKKNASTAEKSTSTAENFASTADFCSVYGWIFDKVSAEGAVYVRMERRGICVAPLVVKLCRCEAGDYKTKKIDCLTTTNLH